MRAPARAALRPVGVVLRAVRGLEELGCGLFDGSSEGGGGGGPARGAVGWLRRRLDRARD